jgi:hypothetical protein
VNCGNGRGEDEVLSFGVLVDASAAATKAELGWQMLEGILKGRREVDPCIVLGHSQRGEGSRCVCRVNSRAEGWLRFADRNFALM